MDRGNSVHNHRSLIPQTKNIGVLQVVNLDDDACHQNNKPITPSCPIPSTYSHYFDALTNIITKPQMSLKTSWATKNK